MKPDTKQEKQELLSKYSKLMAKADQINAKNKIKRFYAMITPNKNGGNPVTIGVYDSLTKKYVLVDTRSHELEKCVQEIDKMISKAQ
jgi:hypothetical protein